MKLKIIRKQFDDQRTIGELLVNGVHECWTLEDRCADQEVTLAPYEKIKGKTAIPAGDYLVIVDFSARFQKNMPHVLTLGREGKLGTPDGVGFTGVRIHSGNTEKDTEGCVLVGDLRESNAILNSGAAYGRLFRKLEQNGEVELSIVNEPSDW